MLLQRGHGGNQSGGEARYICGGECIEGPQLDVAGNNGSQTPVVGTGEGADPGNLELSRIDCRQIRG